MREVIIVAPEFPPQNSAAVHRSRIFASFLPKFGWKPTVLTVKEDQIEGSLDRDLLKTLPESLEIIRTGAIPIHPWRIVGDMGLRSLWHHGRALERLCRQRRPDLIFIPGPPWFMFLLGPRFLKRYGIPYVIDYIDPWRTRVPGKHPLFGKSAVYDFLAGLNEKKVLQNASHVTAVSEGIGKELMARYGLPKAGCFTAMPYGANPDDFEAIEKLGVRPPDFDPQTDFFNICFTGAIQPNGDRILRTFFKAVLKLKERAPEKFSKIRLRFYGTSNRTCVTEIYKVLPLAKEFGLETIVSEIPERVPYLQALAVQKCASVNLVMGSTDHYYHASKLYPCLLAGKPILAICHERSSIAKVLVELGADSGVVTFADPDDLLNKSDAICEKISCFIEGRHEDRMIAVDKLEPYSASGVTRILADIFDGIVKAGSK